MKLPPAALGRILIRELTRLRIERARKAEKLYLLILKREALK